MKIKFQNIHYLTAYFLQFNMRSGGIIMTFNKRYYYKILSAILIIVISIIYLRHVTIVKRQKSMELKARQDCLNIAVAVRQFNTLEYMAAPKLLKYITSTYLRSGITLLDPWKNEYNLDSEKFMVFSNGPDKIAGTEDDIKAYYSRIKDNMTLVKTSFIFQ